MRLFVITLLACGLVGCRAQRPRAVRPAQHTGEVNLLAMGDWGTAGAMQKTVAETMADYVARSGRRFDAALLAGDNFYVRLSGVDDLSWWSMFEGMYDRGRLNLPFYASFGNHDYREKETQIEIDYSRLNPGSRWKCPAKWYRVDLPSRQSPIVTVLMLDSNRPSLTDDEWQEELAWLRWQLAKPRTAAWMICCAHHPLFSNGDHGDNGVLQRDFGQLFQKYGVDLYVAGHDHDLQHLEILGWRTSFVQCGGGGASTRPMRIDRRGPFSQATNGFAHLAITPDRVTVRYVKSDGRVLHEFTRDRSGQVTVVSGEPSDVATTRTVKSITRDGEQAPSTTRVSPWSGSGKD